MVLLIFASSKEVLHVARAKWHPERRERNSDLEEGCTPWVPASMVDWEARYFAENELCPN